MRFRCVSLFAALITSSVCDAASESLLPPGFAVLDPATFAPLLGSDAAWAVSNIPFFECSDPDLTSAYYFRWRTYHRHIAATGDASVPYVVTEFAPLVPWAGSNNTIPCAAGHHITEGRWLRNVSVIPSYSQWWTSGLPGVRQNYYYWLAAGVRRYIEVVGNTTGALLLVSSMLPNAADLFRAFANGTLPPSGAAFDTENDCLWNRPGNEGQENSISGAGCRPLVQALMTGEADAMAELAAAVGKSQLAAEFTEAATIWRNRTLRLWNANLSSFDTWVNAAPPMPPPPMPPGWVQLNSGTFCCDQAPCVGGQSRFLWEGAATVDECTTRCDVFSGGICHFVTVSQSGWCQVVEFCNSTSRFEGGPAWTFSRPGVHSPLRMSPTLPTFAGVRELASLSSPWLFGVIQGPAAAAQFASSWEVVFDTDGFLGPFGLRTAEHRHPKFACHPTGCCAWGGPVWPFETSKVLRAAIDIMQSNVAASVPQLTRTRVWDLLAQYTRMHVPNEWVIINGTEGNVSPANPAMLAPFFLDGLSTAWIAESGCADSGNWTDNPLGGYWYNHATFNDLILSGLVGLVPAANGATPSLKIAPLVPTDTTLTYFCADAVSIGGRNVTVLWDIDGARYGRGKGLRVLLDGELVASADTLLGAPLTVTL